MPQRRHVARAALTAAAATACLALATPTWAAVATQTGNAGHNPNGDNGTVKIDGAEFSDRVQNEPHVTCDFELEFFNFDEDQAANISLTAQAPSGQGQVVWSMQNVVISDDPAKGAENDHDAAIMIPGKDLDLTGLELQPKQGYHLKLNVHLTDGKAFDDKHKVFWVQPCGSSESPSPTPSSPGGETPAPGGSDNPSANPSGSAGGGSGGGTGTEGGLPLTGVAATSTALTGLALIGGGVALMVLRRRRDKITFTS
ncbi:LPXTG cell wall anchor domain-containing protein [Micromonospora sp. NBC_00898]|uniref:LPXTG cell wall anchor domain-containing protein n=1 Tax=Micromonospora sp. NBC_00898 TaxID=2975981 RepID=UPI003868FE8D|nr:LPXTG cell wall anchor domain-containing protein [Micromonospora sp. NBC_00898]